jgi:D-glycero-D-manno-heptose 1,7-bisphosphate phosphatase
LDRDGVLNEVVLRGGKPHPPSSLDHMRLISGVEEALAGLKRLGLFLVVITNQPDVARGTQSASEVERMHGFLREKLPLDDILVCCHDDSDNCPCRKPRPGMITEAANRHGLVLENSFLIGDRWRDIDAGQAAGCCCVFIDYAYNERGPSRPPDARVTSILEAARWIADSMGRK